MELETAVVRGFSNTFVTADRKTEVTDMQFLEGGELERTWKSARRQRLKQQEDKIWSEFVKEQDLIKSVCSEDPYQFLDNLPEAQIKELMEAELSRIKQKQVEQKCGAGDSPRNDNPHTVTFSEIERDDEVFHIFDEDKEYDSGGEENLNDTLESPCTVREREETSGNENSVREKLVTVGKTSATSVTPTEKNSTENVATVIESSIYCAKVKDLRIKIVAEVQQIILSLENQNVANLDPTALRKICHRAAEYCARFQRIHLYKITRQINDIKRHNALAVPFAKHTQFQSQMVRIVALHQSMLQSLQVFHKSFEQTSCLGGCAEQLRALGATLRAATAVSAHVAAPRDLAPARDLYHDNMEAACDQLDRAVLQYVARVNEYTAAADRTHSSRSKRSGKNKMKKKSIGSWSQKASKNTSKTDANARLSMYSLETLRLNRKGTSKLNLDKLRGDPDNNKKGKNEKDTPKSHRKSPRSRRPLMRDPQSGQERRRPRLSPPPDDIRTMVEAVDAPLSLISQETSPNITTRGGTPRRCPLSKEASPRAPPVPPLAIAGRAGRPVLPALTTLPTPLLAKTPMNRRVPLATRISPRVPMKITKRMSPYVKTNNHNLRSETQETVTSTGQTIMPDSSSPISKIQCDKKKQRLEDDVELKTMISESNLNDNLNDSARSGSDTFRVQNMRKSGANICLDSTRSETNRTIYDGKDAKVKAQSARCDLLKTQEREDECEVSKLLKQLCGGDGMGSKNERLIGAKNAQLVCVNGGSPRQPTTPQLLRILEETIQKKIPKQLYTKPKANKGTDKLRLAFNIPQHIADNHFHYRTKFVQHMLTSSMYANSVVGKPWEMIGNVSELIIDDVLMKCVEEMQIQPIISELYKCETK